MKNKLANYLEVITDDGSVTVFSKVYGEACHSKSGARLETQLHYINGCKIVDQIKINNPLVVFEAGFGVGIGLEETVSSLDGHPCVFITTEIDEDLVQYVISKNSFYKSIQRYTDPLDYYLLEKDNLKLFILLGDARKTTPQISMLGDFKFNCVYQDAFSPKRNAVLWTKEWFKTLKELSHDNCIMSTYSASSSIRKSMVGAGWTIYNGDDFGVKRSSTRAKLTGQTSKEILERLEKSPVPMITDDNYKEYTLGN